MRQNNNKNNKRGRQRQDSPGSKPHPRPPLPGAQPARPRKSRRGHRGRDLRNPRTSHGRPSGRPRGRQRGGAAPAGGAGPTKPRCGWGRAPRDPPPAAGSRSPGGARLGFALRPPVAASLPPPERQGAPGQTFASLLRRAGSPAPGGSPPVPAGAAAAGRVGGPGHCSSCGPAAHAPGAGRGAALHARLQLRLQRRRSAPPPPQLTLLSPGQRPPAPSAEPPPSRQTPRPRGAGTPMDGRGMGPAEAMGARAPGGRGD
ncbi:basic proline-rich protein-like [Corapipo altera]|uniref:basic proline-rich protein-like n=1 Tax=Corapipo altera TaxID=415028 RepID=UPI000FD6A599|nr:basic proline-rich protein-like [Corapipo altera]